MRWWFGARRGQALALGLIYSRRPHHSQGERYSAIAGPSWLRKLDARPRQSDGAITKFWSISEFSSPSDQSTLCWVAQQKIWVHWLLWLIPVVSYLGGPVSAIAIRNPMPLINAILVFWGLGMVFNQFQMSALDGWVWLNSLLLSNFVGGISTTWIILRARKRVVALR